MNCRNETSFWIYLEIRQTKFRDITQVKEFTFDDFVGTCGGYIGMFLGYALIQFPQFLQVIFHKIKNNFFSEKHKNLLEIQYNNTIIQLA